MIEKVERDRELGKYSINIEDVPCSRRFNERNGYGTQRIHYMQECRDARTFTSETDKKFKPKLVILFLTGSTTRVDFSCYKYVMASRFQVSA